MVDVPVTEVLVEKDGIRKHVWRVRKARRFPIGNVLIERQRAIEHEISSGQARDIPSQWAGIIAGRASVIERQRAIEHAVRADHVADVPVTDVLVERRRRVEHPLHLGHVADVPVADVLVECRRFSEHQTQIGDGCGWRSHFESNRRARERGT